MVTIGGVIIKNLIIKLRAFVENKKRLFIIVAVVLLLIAFVIAMVFSCFSGIVQTIGYIVGSIICAISAAMFMMVGSLDRKKIKQNKTETESTPAERPKIKKKVSKFIFVISIIMIISCTLCACGLFLILSNVSAVRISGIVIASVFGFIAIIIALFFHFFIY